MVFEKCFERLQVIAGRTIDASEREALRASYEAKVLDAMTTDQPRTNALQTAFDTMMAEAVHQRELAKYRANLNTLKIVEIARRIDEVADRIPSQNKIEAISRLLSKWEDNRTGAQSVEEFADGIYQVFSPALGKITRAIGSRWLGLREQADSVRVFMRAVMGEEVRAADFPEMKPEHFSDIKRAAESWSNLAETLRIRANRAGADIGKLDGWGVPQAWDLYRVREAGRDAWKADVFPLLDRNKMVDAFGKPLDDAGLNKLLDEAYLTISTDGASKSKSGPVRGGSQANRGSQERVLHFKSADAAMAMASKYAGQQLLSVMDGHVRSMSRQVAMLETGGPSFRSNIEKLLEMAKTEQARTSDPGNLDRLAGHEGLINAQLNILTGTASAIENARVASFFQGWRNLQVVRLAGATINSLVSDPVQYRSALVLHSWDSNQPLLSRLSHALGQQVALSADMARLLISRDDRAAVENAGLAAEVMGQVLYRHGEDLVRQGWTAAVSQLTMRASLLSALSDARREGFRVTMMSGLADKAARYNYADLGEMDSKLIKGAGITAEHWALFRKAEPDTLIGRKVLTADGILRLNGVPEDQKRAAAEALMGFVTGEDKLSVLTPNMKTRAQQLAYLQKGQMRRGNIRDELMANFLQFKSFPWAWLAQYGRRAQMFDSRLGRYSYMAAMLSASTLAGALLLQVKALLAGQDPQSMDPRENKAFWGAALMAGGGLGFYGDFLRAETNWQGQAMVESLLGPANTQALLYAGGGLTLGRDALAGDDAKLELDATLAADRTVRDVKTMLPSNLWYTRALTDRLLFNQLGEELRPGYVQRLEERARQQYGTEYWWSPGDAGEVRVPEMP